jgi:transcriptional regulator with XRE-family HTH domain
LARRTRTKQHLALTSVLRATRIEKGLTQRQLAAKLGRSENFINKVETGERHLRFTDFFLIAEALDLEPTLLFTRVANWNKS